MKPFAKQLRLKVEKYRSHALSANVGDAHCPMNSNAAIAMQVATKPRSLWRQGLRAGREALEYKAKLIHAADPARLMALGFSLLWTRDGKPVRSVADLTPGDTLVNQLKDGAVESTVTRKKETK